MRRGLTLLICAALLGLAGAALLVRGRMARCAAVPLLAGDLLPPPDFGRLIEQPSGAGALPAGWSAKARGVQVGSFTVSGGGRSFQLIGIANALLSPPIAVRAGQSYCVAVQALADSPVSATRLRVSFEWRDTQGKPVAADQSDWQDVRRWQGPDDRGGWSRIAAGFRAPDDAAQLAIAFHPASDDRVYLDDFHVRPTIGV
ncbi:MAG TPA: polysaccharide deacetylase, partial [Roseiflexaceae bacterium]|nr:polysaccharide deacetylase [Roseiflexaceae bacterium]